MGSHGGGTAAGQTAAGQTDMIATYGVTAEAMVGAPTACPTGGAASCWGARGGGYG